MHVEAAAGGAAVHEAPLRGAVPSADFAHPSTSRAAPEIQGVRRMREEGDGLREVTGARAVEVDVAGVAAVGETTAEPGEFEQADVAQTSLVMAVLRLPKRVGVGKVSYRRLMIVRRHGCALLVCCALEKQQGHLEMEFLELWSSGFAARPGSSGNYTTATFKHSRA